MMETEDAADDCGSSAENMTELIEITPQVLGYRYLLKHRLFIFTFLID